jgi:hypothetical protein
MKQKSSVSTFMHSTVFLSSIGTLFALSCAIAVIQWQSGTLASIGSLWARSSASTLSALEKQWGIQLQGIRLSAAGNLLDFRYRVLDADKAQALVDKKSQPYMLDLTRGSRMSVPSTPTIGSLRQTSIKPLINRSYFTLFANPGAQIKAGDKVTVVIGDFRAEDLIVE